MAIRDQVTTYQTDRNPPMILRKATGPSDESQRDQRPALRNGTSAGPPGQRLFTQHTLRDLDRHHRRGVTPRVWRWYPWL